MNKSRFTVQAKTPSYDDLSVILLHAGRKPVHPALRHHDGELLLDYQVKVLREKYSSGLDLLITLGFDRENILNQTSVKRNVRILINDLYDDTSSAYSALLGLLACCKKNVLILYGDHTFNQNELPSTVESKIIISPTLKTGIGCIITDGIVTNLSYGISNKMIGLILSGKDIQRFISLYKDNLLLYEIINLMIDRGSRFIG